MKKIFSLAMILNALTACGDATETSEISGVLQPNLVVLSPTFKCGQGVVVVEVTNKGQEAAGSSFIRIDQSNAPSQQFSVPSLKPGQAHRLGVTLRSKDGKLHAALKADANGTVTESHENDNTLVLSCGV